MAKGLSTSRVRDPNDKTPVRREKQPIEGETYGKEFPDLLKNVPKDHPMRSNVEMVARLISNNGHWPYKDKYYMMNLYLKELRMDLIDPDFVPGSEANGIPPEKGIYSFIYLKLFNPFFVLIALFEILRYI